MTTNEPDFYTLIEQIVALVDTWTTEHNRRDVTAYKIVVDLRDEAAGRGVKQCSLEYSQLMSDVFTLVYDAYDGESWATVWDVIIDCMDELADAAND